MEPGQKAYFTFLLFLRLYRDGRLCRSEECRLPDDAKKAILSGLSWAVLDNSGRMWCKQRQVPFTIRLDDDRTLVRELPAFMGVVGCIDSGTPAP